MADLRTKLVNAMLHLNAKRATKAWMAAIEAEGELVPAAIARPRNKTGIVEATKALVEHWERVGQDPGPKVEAIVRHLQAMDPTPNEIDLMTKGLKNPHQWRGFLRAVMEKDDHDRHQW